MTLQPGAATDVRFVTSMHAGMDGAHLFRIVVPTNHPTTRQVTYTVKGDFR